MITLFRQAPKDIEKTSLGLPPELKQLLPKSESECFVSTGRSAIAHLIRSLKLEKDDVVLLPTYVAEGVIQPFKDSGVEIRYYHLTADLRPDYDNIAKLIADHSVALLYIYHPFGLTIDLSGFRALCIKNNAYLLEDCAHALFCETPTKDRGDFILYSFNKFLPVPDGALLLSQVSDIDVSVEPSDVGATDDDAIEDYLTHLEFNTEIRNTTDARNAMFFLDTSSDAFELYYARIAKDLTLRAVSGVTTSVLATLNFKDLIQKRRENVQYLLRNLKSQFLDLVALKPPANTVFFAIPALVKNYERDKFIRLLIGRGVLLSTLIDKWSFVPQGSKDFKNEKNFIDNHVLIPINEFLSLDDMKVLVQALNEVEASDGLH